MDITIHRALAQLKTTLNRIEDMNEDESIRYIAIVNNNTSASINAKTEKDIVANYNKYKDLLDNYIKLKLAVTLSNSGITNIDDPSIVKYELSDKKQYTVAQIIVLQKLLELKRDFLTNLCESYSQHLNELARADLKINNSIEKLLGKVDDKTTFETILTTYKEQNKVKAIDPLNLKSTIDALEKEIDELEISCDSALSIANAQAIIKI